MDILRKELNGIYSAQRLGEETLPAEDIAAANGLAASVVTVKSGCAVITDAACDHCYIHSGMFGRIMGISEEANALTEADSSDEDAVYDLIHPEDLVDKRFLEYEFFKMVDSLPASSKLSYTATCRLRMRDKEGRYRLVGNSTQVVRLSPAGKIWLILCMYDISSRQDEAPGIEPRIINTDTGEIRELSFAARRRHVLSDREKEILILARDGKPSKQIADILGISIHTVNRHRQNIISKLSVGNTIEAVTAATAMGLL